MANQGSSLENGPEPPEPMPLNDCFTREQTVFLIDLIRHHILNEGQSFPKTLYELNSRLKSAMGTRKALWEDAAQQLCSHFGETFQPQKVTRKWHTLVEGYTKAKGLISSGKERTKYQFYSEMDDIMGNMVCEQHDEVFPVVVAPEEEVVHAPLSFSSFREFSKSLKAYEKHKSTLSPYRGVSSPQSVPAAPVVQLQENKGFSRDQVLFLIGMMRQHIITEGEGLPKNTEELDERLSAKANKKQLWEDASKQLTNHFMEYFCPVKIAKKWASLVQGYKNVNNRDTGQKNCLHFIFYSEMDELFDKDWGDLLSGVVTAHAQEEARPESDAQEHFKPETSNGDAAALNHNTATTGISQETFDVTITLEDNDPTFNQSETQVPSFSQSQSSVPLKENESFTREHTLFLIDLMRQLIEKHANGPPKTLKEMNRRLDKLYKKGRKKELWINTAQKMAAQFGNYFNPQRVARKWNTLLEAYARVLESMALKGYHSNRFLFFPEIDALINQHNVPVSISTQQTGQGTQVSKPMTLSQHNVPLSEITQQTGQGTQVSKPITTATTGISQKTFDVTITLEDIDPTFSQSETQVPSFSQSQSSVPQKENESFTREQTLFLIDLMRQFIENYGDGPPKTLNEMNRRLRACRGTKKELWKDTAEKMSAQFKISFNPEKVARKWTTLLEAYRKVRENISFKGKYWTRFHFYSEMDSLMDNQNDMLVSTSMQQTCQGTQVSKPMTLSQHDVPFSKSTQQTVQGTQVSKPMTLSQHDVPFSESTQQTCQGTQVSKPMTLSQHDVPFSKSTQQTGQGTQVSKPMTLSQHDVPFSESTQQTCQGTQVSKPMTLSQHDVPFSESTQQTGQGTQVSKPMTLSQPRHRYARARTPTDDDDEDYVPPSLKTPVRSTHKRRREDDDDLLQFLREAEEANQRRHRETMEQLRSIQTLMTKLIDKL